MGDAPAQRRGAVFADPPKSGFDPDDAAKRGRDADRAAAVRGDGSRAKSRGHRRAWAARTAAGEVVGGVRVARRAVVRIQAGHANADLVHVGLADQQRAGRSHAGDDGGIFLARRLSQEGGADAGRVRRHVHLVLDRHRHAVEYAERPSRLDALRRLPGLPEHIFTIHGDDGAQGRLCSVAGHNGLDHAVGHVFRRDLPLAVGFGVILHRTVAETESGQGWRAWPFLLGYGLRLDGQRSAVIDWLRGWRLIEALLSQPGDAAALEQAGDQQAAQGAFHEFDEQAQHPACQIGQFDRLEVVFGVLSCLVFHWVVSWM